MIAPRGTLVAVVALLPCLAGCAVSNLLGGMAQNAEYQKQVEIPPRYDGLEQSMVAVIVDADLDVRWEHPTLVDAISQGLAMKLAREVPGIRVVAPNIVARWKYETPHWSALTPGEMIEQLGTDRVVHVDLLEYRLNPPGNRWQWEGVCSADVAVIERGSYDPDAYADHFTVTVRFPPQSYLTRSEATEQAVGTGLMIDFVKRTAWLFHAHLEPKYPDKYRPTPRGVS